ncbi:MAG TPA: hypothetical protein VHW44_20275 [Pseudonocardiaceae bacterium]|jgi:hypothetical protein|nr:hypothetical protein [Pseudonocardiaceae bacterium]
MKTHGVWTAAVIGAVFAATLSLGVLPASAATPKANPDGVASPGSASVVQNGTTKSITGLARCDVDNKASASSPGASIANIVSYGSASSTCTKDATADTTKSVANGSKFELDALVPYGGPRIRFTSYQVSCAATTGGTSANWTFSGMTGLTGLPQQIPTDYTQTIKGSQNKVVAKVVLNEIILPNPNDGSIRLHLMHIVLFPNGGGPLSGNIYLGSTACSPTF